MNQIEMVNLALTALGASRISNIDDDTREESRVMKTLYMPTVEEVLTLFPWPSSTTRARLAQISDGADLTKWAYAYQLPADVCYVVSMLDADDYSEYELSKSIDRASPLSTPFFEREGTKIYTDSDECVIKYVKFPAEPDGLRDILGEAIGMRLAQKACLRLNADASLSQKLEMDFERALLRAKAADSIDRRSDSIEVKTWGDYR